MWIRKSQLRTRIWMKRMKKKYPRACDSMALHSLFAIFELHVALRQTLVALSQMISSSIQSNKYLCHIIAFAVTWQFGNCQCRKHRTLFLVKSQANYVVMIHFRAISWASSIIQMKHVWKVWKKKRFCFVCFDIFQFQNRLSLLTKYFMHK